MSAEIISHPGRIAAVDEAQRTLRKAVATEPTSTEACERAAGALADLMLAARIDKPRIKRKLRKFGLSRRGARQIVRAACSRRESYPSNAVRDADGWQDEAGSSPWAKGPQHGQQSREDLALCPHCLEPVGRFDHFCPSCAGPVTAHASVDPLGQIYAAGRGYRRATSSRATFAVFLGMWLIFGPQILLLFLGISVVSSNLFVADPAASLEGSVIEIDQFGRAAPPSAEEGFPLQLFKLGLMLGLLVLYAAILTRVTRRYLQSRPQESPGTPPAP